MANQIITGQKVTFFDSIDFNRKYYEGSYYATYNSLINGELHPDTILGTDIGGAIFFSPPANSYYAHITHGGKIYTLGSAVITETPTSLANVKKNPDVDLEQPIDDSWTNGAFMTSGLVGNEKLPAYFTAAPWDKTITVNTTNVTVTDLLKVINKLCAEVAALKHGSSKIPVTPIAPQPREFYEPTEPQPLISQTEVTGVIMEYRVYTSPVASTTPEPSGWSREIPKAKEPDIYTVEWRAIAEEGYVLTGTTTGSVKSTIKENVPTEFAVVPTITAKTGIKYGDPIDTELITVTGQAKHCTIKYKLNGGTEVTNIPTLDTLIPGEHTISWIATADEGYTFEDGQQTKTSSLFVTINKGITTLSIEGVNPSETTELTLGTEGVTITINGTNCEFLNISWPVQTLRIVNTDIPNKKQIIGIDTTDEPQKVTITGVSTDSSLYDNPTPIELNFIVKAAPIKKYYYIGWEQPTDDNITEIINKTYPSYKGSSIENKAGGEFTDDKPSIDYGNNTLYNGAGLTNYYVVIPNDYSIYDSFDNDLIDENTLVNKETSQPISGHTIYKSKDTSRNIGAGIILHKK